MNVRVNEIAVANPASSYTQAEMLELLGLAGDDFAQMIFDRCGVKRRHFELTPDILGTTLQEVRFCAACGRETELHLHDCGRPTRPLRGASWCSNDTVNALATMVGGATAITVARFWAWHCTATEE